MGDVFTDRLGPRIDGELSPNDARDVDRHLETCAACAREYAALAAVHRSLSEKLMRHTAPDVLRARIRGALMEPTTEKPAPSRERPWWRLVAAGVVIAAMSSALTFAAVRGTTPDAATDELLASHLRSLQPGHLIDVASTNQHTVKPWFNGRVDLSPTVPNLDSLGFPLVGGRTDYVRDRAVPVIVYARRQHLINVYVWPTSGASSAGTRSISRNGYHFISWRMSGLEYEAVSDLNTGELDQFAASFRAAR